MKMTIHVGRRENSKDLGDGRWTNMTYCGISFETDVPKDKCWETVNGWTIDCRPEAWGWRATCERCLILSRDKWAASVEQLYRLIPEDVLQAWKEKVTTREP